MCELIRWEKLQKLFFSREGQSIFDDELFVL